MIQWEYKLVEQDREPDWKGKSIEAFFNFLGQAGWELVLPRGPAYLFKRPVKQ